MARGECENPRPDCWQPDGPYSDEHHKYWPSTRYVGWLALKFRNLPENKEQDCRCDHDEIHAFEPPDRPSRTVMRGAIIQAYLDGRISLSAKQRRILGL